MLWMHKKYSEDFDDSVTAATTWHHSRTSFLKSWILQCISWDHCRGLTPLLPIVYFLQVLRTCSWPPLHWGEAVIGILAHVALFGRFSWMPSLATTLNKVKCKREDSELRWGNQSWGWHQYMEPKRAFLWEWQKLSSATSGLLSNRPWAMKKPKKESQEERKRTDTFLENYFRLLIFQACGLPEPPFFVLLLNSSWWIQGPFEEITEGKSLATWVYIFLLIHMMLPILLPLSNSSFICGPLRK